MIEKPLVTVSGNKLLFKSNLHDRIIQDLPQEGIEWRRRLDTNSKSVYIDVDFVDFDVDNVERSSERCLRLRLMSGGDQPDQVANESNQDDLKNSNNDHNNVEAHHGSINKDAIFIPFGLEEESKVVTTDDNDNENERNSSTPKLLNKLDETSQHNEASQVFFNQKLLGRPILHTYWADKSDIEGDDKKTQFDDWIGQVQASTCTEWAIIIIEDGDSKGPLGTALFKSKLQSTNQANASSTSITSMTHNSSSFLDRMKKGLSTMFQNDSSSERWLTLINQDRLPDSKAQESYNNFMKKFRSLVVASFSKQVELVEENLRVQRDMRVGQGFNFFLNYFSMQEELAMALEGLTLFDEALVQYDLLDALYTEYILSPVFNSDDEPLFEQWTSVNFWPSLCLNLKSEHSLELRRRIVEKRASHLDFRNYIFAKQCDLLLLQNQPFKVAASATSFLQSCISEVRRMKINVSSACLAGWAFCSALEVLERCECYSFDIAEYSLYTVDIWNYARTKLLELGLLLHLLPASTFSDEDVRDVERLLTGLGPDPHFGLSYQKNEISPQARLRDALASKEKFSKHLTEISELTLGTFKHIGRKRQALLVGKDLAEFYITQNRLTLALPFLIDYERVLIGECWSLLQEDIQKKISICRRCHDIKERVADEVLISDSEIEVNKC